jgi:hypothetical protein
LLKLKKDPSEAESTGMVGKNRASSASECTGPKKKLVLRRVAYRPPEKDAQLAKQECEKTCNTAKLAISRKSS